MPDKTRLPEWSMAVLENPQGDPFELENHDVEDMASASVPKKTLVARKKSMATKLRHSLTDVRNENFRQNGQMEKQM